MDTIEGKNNIFYMNNQNEITDALCQKIIHIIQRGVNI